METATATTVEMGTKWRHQHILGDDSAVTIAHCEADLVYYTFPKQIERHNMTKADFVKAFVPLDRR